LNLTFEGSSNLLRPGKTGFAERASLISICVPSSLAEILVSCFSGCGKWCTLLWKPDVNSWPSQAKPCNRNMKSRFHEISCVRGARGPNP
jgi:hypothetical protein